MFRSLFRTTKHILLAALLLAGVVCALEVGLRVRRFRAAVQGEALPESLAPDTLVQPSYDTFVTLRPHARVEAVNDETARPVPIRINSFGCRGAEPVIPKPTGTYRVLCLGDDTTFARELPEHETYTELVRARLQERTELTVEVLNAGLPDGCPLTSLLRLRHDLLTLQPDLVLLHFDLSDLTDDHRIRRHARIDSKLGPLSATHPRLDQATAEAWERLEDEFLLVRYLRYSTSEECLEDVWPSPQPTLATESGKYLWLSQESSKWQQPLEYAWSPVPFMRDLLAGSYAELLVATCPKAWQISPNGGSRELRKRLGIPDGAVYDSREPVAAVQQLAAADGIRFLDTTRWFEAEPSPERLFGRNYDGLSAEGHALYGAILAEFVFRAFPENWSAPVNPSGPAGGAVPQLTTPLPDDRTAVPIR